MSEGFTYKKAGVDIDVSAMAKKGIKKAIEASFTRDLMLGIGNFAGAISAKRLKKFREPVLVGSMDGVGTKMKIAALMGDYSTIGKDLIYHSVNDVLCVGAEPFFFLDYIAAEKIEPNIVEQIVKGMSKAAKEFNMPILGGETATMPSVYHEGEYDLAGCIVGIMEKKDAIDGKKIKAGDVVIALPSNGLHTNGYSLARKVLFELSEMTVDRQLPELGTTLGKALLLPHKPYSKEVLKARKRFEINGIAHITGGGLQENVVRILPKGLGVEIAKAQIDVLPIFKLIQEKGNIPENEMWRTFNMGVGLVLIAQEKIAGKLIRALPKRTKLIGKVVKGERCKLIE